MLKFRLSSFSHRAWHICICHLIFNCALNNRPYAKSSSPLIAHAPLSEHLIAVELGQPGAEQRTAMTLTITSLSRCVCVRSTKITQIFLRFCQLSHTRIQTFRRNWPENCPHAIDTLCMESDVAVIANTLQEQKILASIIQRGRAAADRELTKI